MSEKFCVSLDSFESTKLLEMAKNTAGKGKNYSVVISSLIRRANYKEFLKYKAKEALQQFQHYQEMLSFIKEEECAGREEFKAQASVQTEMTLL